MNDSNFIELPTFKFWCQKVLPLVYDDSLSYYEILCKIVKYINNMIENQKEFTDELNKLQEEITVIQKWIDNFDTTYIEKIIEKYLATMIFVEITDSGYFVYYIPEQWADITFETTGLDVEIPNTEYGRLVLIY
jgi:hypothetical protein